MFELLCRNRKIMVLFGQKEPKKGTGSSGIKGNKGN